MNRLVREDFFEVAFGGFVLVDVADVDPIVFDFIAADVDGHVE